MDENKQVPTPEELEQEQKALQEAKEEEVRASVISEFGFDEELDADKIETAVAKEIKHRQNLSQAIGQKIKYRELANKPKETTPPIKSEVKIDPEEVNKIVDTKVKDTLEQRDLDSMEYPDDIKNEIKRIAQISNISVNQAVKDPYIVSKIETYEKKKKTDEATISRTHKSGSTHEFDINNPPPFDYNDPEGSDKAMKDWEEEAHKRGF